MSSLKVGLVSSCQQERDQLVDLLEKKGTELIYNIAPAEISGSHIQSDGLNVWLLNIDDESWHDKVDDLLDESEVPVYFSEPGTLAKQNHPEFWCSNLLERLYEITGLEKSAEPTPSDSEPETSIPEVDETELEPEPEPEPESSIINAPESNLQIDENSQASQSSESAETLESAIDALEVSAKGLPSELAAELVSELEDLSPVLQYDVEDIKTPTLDTEKEIEAPIELTLAETDTDITELKELDLEAPETGTLELDTPDLDGTDLEESELEESGLEGSEFEGSELEGSELEELELEESELEESELEGSELDDLELDEPELDEPELDDPELDEPELGELELEFPDLYDAEPIESESHDLDEAEARLDALDEGYELQSNEDAPINQSLTKPREDQEITDNLNSLTQQEDLHETEQSMSNAIFDRDLDNALNRAFEVSEEPESQQQIEAAYQEITEILDQDGTSEIELLNVEQSALAHEQEDINLQVFADNDTSEDEIDNEDEINYEISHLDDLDDHAIEHNDLSHNISLGLNGTFESDTEADAEIVSETAIDSELELDADYELDSLAEDAIDLNFESDIEFEAGLEAGLEADINSGAESQAVLGLDPEAEDNIDSDISETFELELVDEEASEAELGSLELQSESRHQDSSLAETTESDKDAEGQQKNEQQTEQHNDKFELSLEPIAGEGLPAEPDWITEFKSQTATSQPQNVPSNQQNVPSNQQQSEATEQGAQVDGEEQIAEEKEPLLYLSGVQPSAEEILNELTQSDDKLETGINLQLNEQDKADLMAEISADEADEIDKIDEIEVAGADSAGNELENREQQLDSLLDQVADQSDKSAELETLDSVDSTHVPAVESAFSVDSEIIPEADKAYETESFEIPLLDETASGINFESSYKKPIAKPITTPCWVIGASLGGPAAVKRFLQCLPADINASFVIAQHIDENFLSVLSDILTTNSEFEVSIAQGSHPMNPGKVVIAPLNGKIDFLTDGALLVDYSQKWTPPYSPCINDVIQSVGKAYGALSGAIIFSGMGDDGMNGAKKMQEYGGRIWAQSPDTCANASMPESVINSDLAEYIGSPEELASKLVEFLAQ